MKVAIYSRKSKFTGKGESVENQINLCKEYAQLHLKGDLVFEVYEDEGFSGGNINRPQFKRMMSDARKKKFDVLICYRLDRIARNVLDFSSTFETLESNNIGFVSIKEQFDTSTPMGRAMLYISSVFAQLERETIAERIRDNMMQLAKTGRWLGGNCPTGFISEPIVYLDENMKEKKMFKLTPVDEELSVVKVIFEKYLELQSLSGLETYCLQNDILTKENNTFQKSSLRAILSNPVYAAADKYVYEYFLANDVQVANSKEEFNGKHGVMAYNKKLVKKGQSVKTKDMSEWICAIGMHKGIISGKDWVAVQQTISENKDKAPRQGTSENAVLSGLMNCTRCGSFLRVRYGKKSKATGISPHYYVCNIKVTSQGSKCDSPNLNGKETDANTITALKKMINEGALKNIDKNKKQIKDKTAKLKQIQEKIVSNQKAIDNLVKQLSQNSTSSVAKYIIAEMEKLEDKNKELQASLEKDTTELELFNLELLKDAFITFSETIDDASDIEKKRLIKSIVKRIYWNGESLDIKLFEL